MLFNESQRIITYTKSQKILVVTVILNRVYMEKIDKLIELIEFDKLQNKKQAFQSFSDRYKNNSGKGGVSLKTKDEAKAYVVGRMPATIGAISFCLKKLHLEEIKSVLDLGAGTGAGLISLSEAMESAEVQMVENSNAMIEILEKTQNLCENLNSKIIKQDLTNLQMKNISYNLVMANYVLNELPDEKIEKTLKLMYELSNNYMLIIEAGSMFGFNRIMKYKDILLSLGAKIISPCKSLICPLKNDFCEFRTRIQRPRFDQFVKSAEKSYEDENFIYIIMKKGNFDNISAQNIVIRRPEYKKGQVDLCCCTKDFGVKNIKITKSQGAIYKKARKFGVGDEF